METLVDSGQLLGLSARLCCVGVLTQSWEILRHHEEWREEGLFGWTTSDVPAGHPLGRLVRRLHRYPACVALLGARGVAAAACLFLPAGSAAAAGVLAFLVLAQLYYHRRGGMLGSACDTMQLMVFGAALAGGLPGGSESLKTAALGFLAAQVLIAYVASGLDKALAPPWRSGVQLSLVFNYSLHRFPALGAWFGGHPRGARAVAWSVILLELLFPLCLLLPGPGFWIFIAAGLLFHGAIAFVMGLHGFWWSFAAAYPALYFVQARLTGLLAG